MKRQIAGVVVTAIVLLFTNFAGGAATTEVQLPPNALLITRTEIEAGQYGQDLFEILSLLSTRAGITFKSSSDVGAEDWLLIRGFPRDSSRNVLVLLDGRPINAASTDAVDFTDVPLDIIDRIIVYRPPMPPRFGGYHAAVEVFTRRPEVTQGELSAAGGSLDTQRFGASVEGVDSAGYLLQIERFETDNLTGVRRTPPKENQVYGDRSYHSTTPVLKLSDELGNGLYGELYVQAIDDHKRFSNIIFRGEPEQRERQFRSFALNLERKPDSPQDFHFTVFRNDEDDHLNLMLHPGFRSQDRYRQGLSGYWNPSMSSDKVRLTLGGDFTDIHAKEFLGTELNKLNDEHFFGIFAQGDLSVGRDTAATLGLRLDDHSETDSDLSPYVSLVHSANPGSSFYAIWAKNTRWPSLSEFNDAVGPTPLRAERLNQLELGWRGRSQSGDIQGRISLFRLDLTRESSFVFIPPFTFGYTNLLGRTRSEGVEAELDAQIGPRTNLFANWTWNEVETNPGDEPVPFGAPKVLANVGATYREGRATVYAVARYRGHARGVQAMMAAPTELDAHFLLDFAVTRSLGRNSEAFLRASNLFDKLYETFDGRPMFERVILGGG